MENEWVFRRESEVIPMKALKTFSIIALMALFTVSCAFVSPEVGQMEPLEEYYDGSGRSYRYCPEGDLQHWQSHLSVHRRNCGLSGP